MRREKKYDKYCRNWNTDSHLEACHCIFGEWYPVVTCWRSDSEIKTVVLLHLLFNQEMEVHYASYEIIGFPLWCCM